ncbi:MAG: T9SS type A sorting domain-containing protein [Ignavibacteriae bacterium]|nr:T9SS type A sorting domain-containing protein [Ignavibacteriota bacterium]
MLSSLLLTQSDKSNQPSPSQLSENQNINSNQVGSTQTNFWQTCNGPYGGYITSVAINSTGDIYVGTFGRGVYRTTDNGENWTQVTIDFPHLYVDCLSINDSGHIFAGSDGSGIYRSTDNGENWTWLANGLTNMNIQTLAINDSGHIFAGTGAGGGIFRSTNNGNNWTNINSGLTFPYIWSIAFNDSGHVFAGAGNGNIYQSKNNGDLWLLIDSGLTTGLITSIAIDNQGKIFASYASSFSSGGVLRSTDNGMTWIGVNNGLNDKSFWSIAVNDSGHLFAGTYDGLVFRTMDHGASWTQIMTLGLKDQSVFSLAFNHNGHVFMGTGGAGVLRSIDNGERWTSINTGLTNIHVLSLATSANGHIFVGTYQSGLYRSTDNGENWEPTNNGLTDSYVWSLLCTPDGQIFAGNYDGIFRSTNDGENWTQVYSGSYIFSFAINSNGDLFAGSYDNVLRSTDNGVTWVEQNIGTSMHLVASLSCNESGHIFAGSRKGVVRSTDNGEHWTKILDGTVYHNSLCVTKNGYLFVSTWDTFLRSSDNGNTWIDLYNNDIRSITANSRGHIFIGDAAHGIFRSTNDGYSWGTINSGLSDPIPDIWALAVSPTGVIFAGSQLRGVFRSTRSTTTQISGMKFRDRNVNGIKDSGDVAWGGWKIYLGGAEDESTYTDWNGKYLFQDLAGGDYIVYQENKPEMPQSLPGNNGVYNITLTVGDSADGIDFGNYYFGSIEGIKFEDLNGNHQRDDNEPGISDWKIRLEGPRIDSVVTDSNGYYRFNSLQPGLYTVSEDERSSWLQTCPDSIERYMIQVKEGTYYTGHDFGNMQFSAIVGKIFFDENQNGVRDSAEVGLSGWKIWLNGPINDSTVTDIKGNYGFSALSMGSYTLSVEVRPYCFHNQSPPDLDSITIADDSLILDTNFGMVGFCTISQLPSSYNQDWNVVSIPVIVPDLRKEILFPFSKSNAFAYEGRYVQQDTLSYGKGYWLKLELDTTIIHSGLPLTRDTIEVLKGWNIIGSFSEPVSIARILTFPESLLVTTFYQYEGSYFSTDTIQPGKGYLVKTNQSGKLFRSSGILPSNFPKEVSSALSSLSRMTIEDATGKYQNLYFGQKMESDHPLTYYELPPLPPVGVFDARFATNRIVEFSMNETPRIIPINISSPQYPLRISWLMNVLQPVNGSIVIDGKTIALNGSSVISIQNPIENIHIQLESNTITGFPKSYALHQNFPNPFNPTTEIKYDLHEDAFVSLIVYDVLGREVQTLLNGMVSAGYNSVPFNASLLPSGVYFYRFSATPVSGQTGSFTDMKKMLLAK